jgi:hypothetical protein
MPFWRTLHSYVAAHPLEVVETLIPGEELILEVSFVFCILEVILVFCVRDVGVLQMLGELAT